MLQQLGGVFVDTGAADGIVPGTRACVYVRGEAALVPRCPAHGFASPRLGIRFDLSGEEMVVYYPDGRPFLPVEKFRAALRQEEKLRLAAQKQADEARQQADEADRRARRIVELNRKARRGEASAEELAELERLENETSA